VHLREGQVALPDLAHRQPVWSHPAMPGEPGRPGRPVPHRRRSAIGPRAGRRAAAPGAARRFLRPARCVPTDPRLRAGRRERCLADPPEMTPSLAGPPESSPPQRSLDRLHRRRPWNPLSHRPNRSATAGPKCSPWSASALARARPEPRARRRDAPHPGRVHRVRRRLNVPHATTARAPANGVRAVRCVIVLRDRLRALDRETRLADQKYES
jgi:hypothetical protein